MFALERPAPPPPVFYSGSGETAGGSSSARVEVGVWKTVEAHSRGGMSALASHRAAPLLATATTSQVRAAQAGRRRCTWARGLAAARVRAQHRAHRARNMVPLAPQVVKVWNTRGEQVGVVRAHTSFLSQVSVHPRHAARGLGAAALPASPRALAMLTPACHRARSAWAL